MKKLLFLLLLLPAFIHAQAYHLEYDTATHSNKNVIVILGDSLTAGSKLERNQTYPAHMQEYFRQQGIDFQVVNGAINGDTTEGASKRVDKLLQKNVFLLIIAVGGNDGLRQYSLANAEKNLKSIIKKAQAKGIEVILMDAQIPASKKAYNQKFNALCSKIAKKMKVPLMPNVLSNVYYNKKLMADSIHPSQWGHWVMTRDVMSYLNEKWIVTLPDEAVKLMK